MKKTLSILLLLGMFHYCYAGDSNPYELLNKVETNGFWSNWFVTANISGKSFYSNEEKSLNISSSPFKSYRTNYGFSTSIGKWFTPEIGLRTKLSGLWGKNVLSDIPSTNNIDYWNVQEQILFNINYLLSGYKENCFWNCIPYCGIGVLRNCTDNDYAHGLSLGIMNTWKLSKQVDCNFELGLFLSDDDFDYSKSDPKEDYALSLSSSDRVYYAEIGFLLHLGNSSWKRAYNSEAMIANYELQIEKLNNSLLIEQEKLKIIKDSLTTAKQNEEPRVIEKRELVISPISVFFKSGSSEIASRKDLENLKELVKLSIKNRTQIVINGYADSKTGSAIYNENLSKSRAQIVADEIVKMGASVEDLIIQHNGGVDIWSPNSYNRRVVVTIKE